MQLDFINEISSGYGFEIKGAVSFRDIYIIETPIGRKFLKKMNMSSARILFIHGAKEHLYKNGFESLDRYLCTLSGTPYMNIKGINYTVSNAIEGRMCNFDNKEDVLQASRLLAKLHKKSNNYIPIEGSLARDNLGKIPNILKKRLNEMRKFKKIAQKRKSAFDYLILQYIDYFYDLGQSSIELMNASHYENLINSNNFIKNLCHHDFSHNNIIFNENNISLINFDSCSFELKIYDLVNFIRRKMRKCNWNIYEAKNIIDEYRKIEDINEDELIIMKAMFQFPQKFWRIANKYYNSKHNFGEKNNISKLKDVIDEIPFSKKFIDKFDILI